MTTLRAPGYSISQVRSVPTVAGFDPVTLSLTGWWRSDYSSPPWTSRSSLGTSSGRTLVTAGSDPSAGTPVNGHVPASFSGSGSQYLQSAVTFGNYVELQSGSGTGGSFAILFKAASASANANGGGAPYSNPGLIQSATSGPFSITFSDAGIQSGYFDGAAYIESSFVPASTGSWHLAQVKYDGSNLKTRIDSGAWDSVAASSLPWATADGTMYVGADFSAARFFDGSMLEVIISNTVLADADFDNLRSYVNNRYALSI